MQPIIINKTTHYKEIGDILLIHEIPQNQPLGGVYSLVLCKTENGPQQWFFQLITALKSVAK